MQGSHVILIKVFITEFLPPYDNIELVIIVYGIIIVYVWGVGYFSRIYFLNFAHNSTY